MNEISQIWLEQAFGYSNIICMIMENAYEAEHEPELKEIISSVLKNYELLSNDIHKLTETRIAHVNQGRET